MELETVLDALNDSMLHEFLPIEFKKHIQESSAIDVTGGTVSRGGVFETHLRIITRETHPIKAINKAKEIQKYLYENVKGAFFNGKKVLNIETTTPEPLSIGEDGGFHMVSFNYKILEG